MSISTQLEHIDLWMFNASEQPIDFQNQKRDIWSLEDYFAFRDLSFQDSNLISCCYLINDLEGD
ncbi:hypothetical protein REC12_14835 [Desulfosporosinus sp. PR]|nr:hypothetical protein [Desulfosporosinus sp. PR]